MADTVPSRQMKLGLFLTGDGNYHMAGWRLPGSVSDAGENIHQLVEFARLAERGKLDLLFVADGGLSGLHDLETMGLTTRIDRMDPIAALSAVAMSTTHLGLAGTISTTYNEPFNVARAVASLDIISGGRGGWNIVTTASKEEAENFSKAVHQAHGDRYERAEEFVDIVRGLWDSFDEGAFPRDKASSRYMDSDKIQFLNHRGKHFSVRGPISVPRSPQGHPILVQAGSSEAGMNLTSRVADVMFTSQADLAAAKTFYTSVKDRTERFGRRPDDLKIMPGVLLVIGKTEREAVEKYEQLQSLIPIQLALRRLSDSLGGVDLSRYPLDEPMPALAPNATRVSSVESYVALARREGLTLRQVAMRAAAAKHHLTLIGSPQQIADVFEEWFLSGAADGFNLLMSDVPGCLNDLVNLVIPELQRRGLFRREYEGRTLRENLGLRVPPFQHRTSPNSHVA